MNWRIKYGMCDGTGPYLDYVEADSMPEAMSIVRKRHGLNDGNFISCVQLEGSEVGPGATFDEWWQAKGEKGKFKLIAQNIIQWIEETR